MFLFFGSFRSLTCDDWYIIGYFSHKDLMGALHSILSCHVSRKNRTHARIIKMESFFTTQKFPLDFSAVLMCETKEAVWCALIAINNGDEKA